MPWWMSVGGSSLVLVLCGGYFLVVGHRLRPPRSRVGWLQVPGTVVDWEAVRLRGTHPGEAYHRTMFPVVEYPLPDGTPRRFRNPTTLDVGVYRTGQSVVVLVDPADPEVAELSTSGRDRTTGRALFMVLGTVFSFLGVVILAVVAMVARALA